MDVGTVIGIGVAFLAIGLGILFGGNPLALIDVVSVFVVLLGTVGATIACFPLAKIFKLHTVALKAVFHKSTDVVEIILDLVKYAELARRKRQSIEQVARLTAAINKMPRRMSDTAWALREMGLATSGLTLRRLTADDIDKLVANKVLKHKDGYEITAAAAKIDILLFPAEASALRESITLRDAAHEQVKGHGYQRLQQALQEPVTIAPVAPGSVVPPASTVGSVPSRVPLVYLVRRAKAPFARRPHRWRQAKAAGWCCLQPHRPHLRLQKNDGNASGSRRAQLSRTARYAVGCTRRVVSARSTTSV